jgi:hypothetical protein
VVQRIGRGRLPVDPALAWSDRLRVEVGGAGTLAHAGVVLPRLLADRLGLTQGLTEVLARAGFIPLRHRGRLLVDAACALAAGATGLTDVEALTRQEELYGPGGAASDTTLLRGLDELADRLGANGLPGRRLARALGGGRGKAQREATNPPNTAGCPPCGSPEPTGAASPTPTGTGSLCSRVVRWWWSGWTPP